MITTVDVDTSVQRIPYTKGSVFNIKLPWYHIDTVVSVIRGVQFDPAVLSRQLIDKGVTEYRHCM